jgi:hypothetical protein
LWQERRGYKYTKAQTPPTCSSQSDHLFVTATVTSKNLTIDFSFAIFSAEGIAAMTAARF